MNKLNNLSRATTERDKELWNLLQLRINVDITEFPKKQSV